MTLREEVFAEMDARKKYKRMPLAFKILEHTLLLGPRGRFFTDYYILMRRIDDIVDREHDPPEGIEDITSWVERKIEFARNPENPEDYLDEWMIHCFQTAKKFKQDFTVETVEILGGMLFDAMRYGTMQLFSAKTLDFDYYTKLDIKGTITGSLKVFRENPTNWRSLLALSQAVRIYYNLRDYEKDVVRDGYVNIPKEIVEGNQITEVELKDVNSEKVRDWMREEARKGLIYLDEHEKEFKQSFKPTTRLVLNVMYEHSTREFLEQMIQ